jgi:hypothetical protein
MHQKNRQNGFAHIGIILAFVTVAVICFAGWRVLGSSKQKSPNASSTSQPKVTDSTPQAISWSNDGSKWVSSAQPPACKSPLTVNLPIDLSKASSILYPGQYRGGNYKPHGGFRFDGSPNSTITVKVPEDSIVYKGSRYIEMGEIQYMFVLIAPCGIMYRFDHLAVLSPTFQKIADTLPDAKVDDSRTTNFTPTPAVKAGDVIATSVGFIKTQNTGLDFGVYDIRNKNQVSSTAAWQQAHPDEGEFGAYAICWLNNLEEPSRSVAKALPGGDGAAGKQSDYCK